MRPSYLHTENSGPRNSELEKTEETTTDRSIIEILQDFASAQDRAGVPVLNVLKVALQSTRATLRKSFAQLSIDVCVAAFFHSRCLRQNYRSIGKVHAWETRSVECRRSRFLSSLAGAGDSRALSIIRFVAAVVNQPPRSGGLK